MGSSDIVFSSYIEDRDVTITLVEGTSSTLGRQHIIHQRPSMESKINVIKHAVENADIAIMDKNNQSREKIYCLGADNEKQKLYMAVVVEYTDESNGTIITAFPEDNISHLGVINYVKHKKQGKL